MIVIFYDMLHDCLEDYVDDIVVKSKEAFTHVNDLRKVFIRCTQYQLRMNNLKCSWCIIRKILRIHCPRKAKGKAIQDMESRTVCKQLKGLVSYVPDLFQSWPSSLSVPKIAQEEYIISI